MVRAILCAIHGPKWCLPLLIAAVTSSWDLPITGASTTYTPVILYPLDPPAGQKIAGIAGAARGQVVGSTETSPNNHALLWNGSPGAIDLGQGNGFATDGIQQVGWDGSSARLWTGTAGSGVQLSLSESVAAGVGGGEQVGTDMTNALLWHGTPDSLIKLSGNDSQGLGTDGVHQVGTMGFRNPHAMLWSGTAASAVDLHPRQFQNIAASAAVAVRGSQQVGYTTSAGLAAIRHAVLWNGTASSAVDLNPSGWAGSSATATNATQQVGNAFVSNTSPLHAAAWSGTPESSVDLQSLLPASYVWSDAYSIDPAGDMFGAVNDAVTAGGPSGRYYAVEWLTHPVVPGDVNLDGKVDFSDLVALARNYGQAGGWLQGDFDNDGTVGFDDLTILARNYGQALTAAQLGWLDPSLRSEVDRAFAEVPEPRCFSVLSLGTGIFLRRCRR